MYEDMKKDGMDKVLIIMVLLCTGGAWLFSYAEPDYGFLDALWWSIVTVTTVGYGDIYPVSTIGRILAVVTMLLGTGVLCVATSWVTTILIRKKIKEDKGMLEFDGKGHTIVCGWNLKAEIVLEEFFHDERNAGESIVLIANVDEKPVDNDLVFFIQGQVTESSLQRAGIKTAKTAVVIGNANQDPEARDAMNILAVLAIETLNPQVYTIVEISRNENVVHCNRANADEVIVGDDFNARLIASAVRDHGVSGFISEILDPKKGTNLVVIDAPALSGSHETFSIMAAQVLKDNIILLGVESIDGKIFFNPGPEYKIFPQDKLIVLKS